MRESDENINLCFHQKKLKKIFILDSFHKIFLIFLVSILMGTCYTKKRDDGENTLLRTALATNVISPVEQDLVSDNNVSTVSQWSELKIEYHKAPNGKTCNTVNNTLLIDNLSIDRECQFDIEINAISP